MKGTTQTIYEHLARIKSSFVTGSRKYITEEPLRSELFSSDKLEEYGRSLAKSHKLVQGRVPSFLLKRLAENESILVEVRNLLIQTIKENHRVTPAGEWLLDNFYLIEEQIRTAKKHLPKRYSENLPQLISGSKEGQARVYDIAIQIISHSEGRIDLESLSGFVQAYQSVMSLQLGELWAIPIMLRLALIENLRRVAVSIAVDRIDRNLAVYWAEQMQDTAEKDPTSLILIIADMARSNPPLDSAFVSELTRKLRGKGPALALPLNWIEQRLSESGLNSNDLINEENQKQASDQVSISNSINSLRLLSAMDWRDFVETHSVVEQTLRLENDGVYSTMDFTTRDRYRHVIESLAEKSDLSEADIAKKVIDLARQSKEANPDNLRKAHVGYYLIGSGIARTKKAMNVRRSFSDLIADVMKRNSLFLYLGSITIITLAVTLGLFHKASGETHNTFLLSAIVLLSIVAASQFAIMVVNFLSTLMARPTLLPRINYAQGISHDSKSLVVVPSMLGSLQDVETLSEALEVRFLANRDANLHFGLLTDFTDAKQEVLPTDQPLLDLMTTKIFALNSKYGRENQDLFYLFHRPRRLNKQDGIWMGYERKRGKLAELNNLLRGKGQDRFSLIIGDQSLLLNIRFVITLDADTQLPRGAASKMIGSMAHPLNRAYFDDKKQRVTHGYGILQPRVMMSLPDSNGSVYAKLNGNEPGIDPYTLATSDVYQDLFGEGSFIGKGIYEVDVFEKALAGKFPENRILSHDLLEGCYTRSGLLSDVQLFEKHPTNYGADVKRRIRWTRGDWQIALWSTPFVKNEKRKWQTNPLSLLSRWKIFDNIRRSVVPIALSLLLITGWVFLNSTLFWTVAVSGLIILPIIVSTFWNLINKPKEIILLQHVLTSGRSVGNIITKTLFTLICLPFEAYYSAKAILITFWRMVITRKKLLEWNPFANEENKKPNNVLMSYLQMGFEVLLTAAVFIALLNHPARLAIAIPILSLWMVAPFVTWFTSKPIKKPLAILTLEQDIFLHNLSRKTWSYFERFVTEEDNFLPPDNFQEFPVEAIAHRTSPTNIGLAALSNLCAYDFGYITTEGLIGRTAKTFDSLNKLERYRGHFYNWYDTQSLQPLHPKYISTVDSGNLAGHMLTFRQGLLGIPHESIFKPKLIDGLLDTMRVVKNVFSKNALPFTDVFFSALEALVSMQPVQLNDAYIFSEELKTKYLSEIRNLKTEPDTEAEWWKDVLESQIADMIDDFKILSPLFLLNKAPAAFAGIIDINNPPALLRLSKLASEIDAEINIRRTDKISSDEEDWIEAFRAAVLESGQIADQRIHVISRLAVQCNDFAEMEWDFLYDKTRNLLTIGYKVDEHHRDPSFYDLLASEARLCTFVTIAQGKLPEESWFALGRLLTTVGGDPILLSWSGSMFEYLMPLLVMPTYENTLLDHTYKNCIEKQIEYGKQREVPWGISESGYNTVDAAMNFQYAAFGVPGLGLKRGLADDLVIAPYASALGLMVQPEKSCQNLQRISEKGFEGRHGLYEAIDYTPSRLPRRQTHAVIQSYMAHHHGMTFLSLAYVLLEKPMQRRFETEPQFQATLLLLQERIPKATSYFSYTTDTSDINYTAGGSEVRLITTPHTAIPRVQLLSNGKYHLMVTNSGGGYSRWKDIAVTRWSEDRTCDNWGSFCYIRDLDSGEYWSNTHQPTLKKSKNYEAAFSEGRVDFRTSDNDIDTHTEIVVSPEDDIEMRRINITNHSGRKKIIDVTSYAEVVLATAAADSMHPAFSKLFVQTEIVKHHHAILCTRRPRSSDEIPPWMFHLMTVHGTYVEEISFETDRMEFIGRGNSVVNPVAMKNAGPLSGKQGSVLDPVVSIRYKVTLKPNETVSLDIITGIGESREVCERLIGNYQDKHHRDRVFELAWTHSQVVLRQINAKEVDAQMYGQLASSIVFNSPLMRADPSVLIKNHRGQSDLWGYSVSGDLPIVLLRIENQNNIQLVKQLIQAHTYWRLKGLIVDLVIWNEDYGGYRQVLQNQIQSLIAAEMTDSPGGIFVRSIDQISNEDRILFQTVARVILSDATGTFEDHIARKLAPKVVIPVIIPTKQFIPASSPLPEASDLIFFNGHGGFSSDGREYIITVDKEKMTPAPWSNVIANKNFGTVISECGQAYTWAVNAHEYRLTPWNNDPVSDAGGESYYLRDEETKHFWSVTPLPCAGESNYRTRHGFGYSIFEHDENGIHSEMSVYVDTASAIKFNVIKIKNNSGETRKLSATGYVEWVLGDQRSKTAMNIITELDPETGALFARNPYNTEFARHVAFFDIDESHRTFTGDRTEFIGRNGTLQNPDAMSRQKLSGKIGSALDPCAAIQLAFELTDGEEREIIFRLGSGNSAGEAAYLVKQFRGNVKANQVFEEVVSYWIKTTGTLTVETPDKAINILTNGWLTYQTIACRLWGRSGYYQSGGAFGFRDQLQDVLSLLHTAPSLAREQILLCASRQFKEGDVQHWWHPPAGRGVRTRCSDDYLWLPFVTSRYLTHTNDFEILNQPASFLQGRQLNPGEDSHYDLPGQSQRTESLYEHCVKALKNGFNYGAHGLPLIGSGDWNDGMDRVGVHGRGESVWLGFFMYDILIRFSEIARAQKDNSFAEECEREAQKLKTNIDTNAWDGEWYRRAYFDDGTPLGSNANAECQIDSLSQSWAVISGAGEKKRSASALKVADERLVNPENRIIRLLDPAFDKATVDPGYIKGYVPGVRENGGQYTHAAIWMIMAYAKLGNSTRAWELLEMINPVNHARTQDEVNIYKVEPYVVAADVYTLSPHTGRGGWTWYSGSAGWMYQLIVDSLLGIKLNGDKLFFDPCIPPEWESFKLKYSHENSSYNILFTQKHTAGNMSVSIDGILQDNNFIMLKNDQKEYSVEIILYSNN
jgi:cyclic beta-1,2-glucan synthetase